VFWGESVREGTRIARSVKGETEAIYLVEEAFLFPFASCSPFGHWSDSY